MQLRDNVPLLERLLGECDYQARGVSASKLYKMSRDAVLMSAETSPSNLAVDTHFDSCKRGCVRLERLALLLLKRVELHETLGESWPVMPGRASENAAFSFA